MKPNRRTELTRSRTVAQSSFFLDFWCSGERQAEVTGYDCDPADKYEDLRDRACLTINGNGFSFSAHLTREQLRALATLAEQMLATIPEPAPVEQREAVAA